MLTGKRITKTKLSTEIAKKTGYPVCKVTQVIDVLLNFVAEKISEGHTVQLTGFGSFKTRPVLGRVIHVPNRATPVTTTDTITPHFVPSINFKNRVKKNHA